MIYCDAKGETSHGHYYPHNGMMFYFWRGTPDDGFSGMDEPGLIYPLY